MLDSIDTILKINPRYNKEELDQIKKHLVQCYPDIPMTLQNANFPSVSGIAIGLSKLK